MNAKPSPRLTPRKRYERAADAWDKAARPGELIETDTRRLIVMQCWYYSDGCLYEYGKKKLSDTFLDYFNACLKARWDENNHWYEEALLQRTSCDTCFERYMYENLSFCTDCLSVYCFTCASRHRMGKNGNRRCGCKFPGTTGGELVG